MITSRHSFRCSPRSPCCWRIGHAPNGGRARSCRQRSPSRPRSPSPSLAERTRPCYCCGRACRTRSAAHPPSGSTSPSRSTARAGWCGSSAKSFTGSPRLAWPPSSVRCRFTRPMARRSTPVAFPPPSVRIFRCSRDFAPTRPQIPTARCTRRRRQRSSAGGLSGTPSSLTDGNFGRPSSAWRLAQQPSTAAAAVVLTMVRMWWCSCSRCSATRRCLRARTAAPLRVSSLRHSLCCALPSR